MSCAILTDGRKNFRPNKYEVSFADCKLSAEYLVVKLTDYLARREELETSNNPFATVILVQLAAMEAKRLGEQRRFDIKCQLTRRLYQRGYSKQQVIDLYRFTDWLIHLAEKDEISYKQYVHELEEKTKMAYVSTIERMAIREGLAKGMQQGMEKGMQKGEELLLVRQLKDKFGEIPANYLERIQQADAEMLLIWGEQEQLLDVQTIEEIFV